MNLASSRLFVLKYGPLYTNIYLVESYLSTICCCWWRAAVYVQMEVDIYLLSKPEEKETVTLNISHPWDYHQHSVVMFFFCRAKIYSIHIIYVRISVLVVCDYVYPLLSNAIECVYAFCISSKEMEWKTNDECIHEPNLWIKFFIWAVQSH